MRTYMVDTEEHDTIVCFPNAYLERRNLEPLFTMTSTSMAGRNLKPKTSVHGHVIKHL